MRNIITVLYVPGYNLSGIASQNGQIAIYVQDCTAVVCMQEVLKGTIMFYIKTKLRTYKAVEQTLNTKLFPVCFYFLLLFKGYVVCSESTVAYSVQYVCVNIRKHIFTDI